MKFNFQKPLFYGLSSVLLVTACKTENKKEVATVETVPGINLSYMDTTTSPKNDFFRYVNGTWLDETTIPDDKTVWGSFNELRVQDRKSTRLNSSHVKISYAVFCLTK